MPQIVGTSVSASKSDVFDTACNRSQHMQDMKGVVKTGVEVLGVVAALTQSVPYLGIISGGLTELLKIYNEVDQFKSEWRSVMDDVSHLKTIIDTVRDELARSDGDTMRLPPGLVNPLKELETCIAEMRNAMDACRPASSGPLPQSRLIRMSLSRGLRVARTILNRKDLMDSVNRCRTNMSTMADVFNAKLNVSHSFALDHQSQRLERFLLTLDHEDLSPPVSTTTDEISTLKLANGTHPLEPVFKEYHHTTPNAVLHLQFSLTVPASGIDWRAFLTETRRVVSRFAPGDQDVIWRGLAALLLAAMETAIGTHGQTLTVPTARRAACATEALETVVPMICMFLLLFMIWKLHSITRPLGWSSGSVILVDFLGRAFELHENTFSTWENTHAFLVEAFQGQYGAPYVTNRAYGIGTSEHLVIASESWHKIVQPGIRLQMSAIVHEQSRRCPYCQTVFDSEGVFETIGDRVICTNKRCGRPYGILQDDPDEEHDSLSEDLAEMDGSLDRCRSQQPLTDPQRDVVTLHDATPDSQSRLMAPSPSSLGLISSILVFFRQMVHGARANDLSAFYSGWESAEKEKIRLYEHARAEVERVQARFERVSPDSEESQNNRHQDSLSETNIPHPICQEIGGMSDSEGAVRYALGIAIRRESAPFAARALSTSQESHDAFSLRPMTPASTIIDSAPEYPSVMLPDYQETTPSVQVYLVSHPYQSPDMAAVADNGPEGEHYRSAIQHREAFRAYFNAMLYGTGDDSGAPPPPYGTFQPAVMPRSQTDEQTLPPTYER